MKLKTILLLVLSAFISQSAFAEEALTIVGKLDANTYLFQRGEQFGQSKIQCGSNATILVKDIKSKATMKKIRIYEKSACENFVTQVEKNLDSKNIRLDIKNEWLTTYNYEEKLHMAPPLSSLGGEGRFPDSISQSSQSFDGGGLTFRPALAPNTGNLKQ